MSLKGGQLCCLNEKSEVKKILKPKGKSIKIGEYFSCDYILEDCKRKGIYFEIVTDAWGRVYIVNYLKDNPINVNGIIVKNRIQLSDGSFINVFDQKFLWKFPINFNNKSSSPANRNCIVKPAPYSDHVKKQYKKLRRLTVHSFLEWIKPSFEEDEQNKCSFEEIQTSTKESDSNEKVEKKISSPAKTTTAVEESPYKKGIQSKEEISVTVKNHGAKLSTEKILDISDNKENEVPVKKLLKCRVSEILFTNYTPLKNKQYHEKCSTNKKLTPKSVYSTPKSAILSEKSINEDNDNEESNNSQNLINFSTPSSTSNRSMHFIDLLTPIKSPQTPYKKTTTTLLKSALKNSVRSALKSNNNLSVKLNESSLSITKVEKIKLKSRKTFQDLIDVSSKENDNQKQNTNNSVEYISLSSTSESLAEQQHHSSLNESSVIEISSLSHNESVSDSVGINPIQNISSKNDPQKEKKMPQNSQNTPKCTPQSLRKKVISSSSKKSLITSTSSKITSGTKKIISPKFRNLSKLGNLSLQKQYTSRLLQPSSSLKQLSMKDTVKSSTLKTGSVSMICKKNTSIPVSHSQSETKLRPVQLKRLQQDNKPSTLNRRLDYAAGLAKKSTINKLNKKPENMKLNRTMNTPVVSKNPALISKSATEKKFKSNLASTSKILSVSSTTKSKVVTKLLMTKVGNSKKEDIGLVKKIDIKTNKEDNETDSNKILKSAEKEEEKKFQTIIEGQPIEENKNQQSQADDKIRIESVSQTQGSQKEEEEREHKDNITSDQEKEVKEFPQRAERKGGDLISNQKTQEELNQTFEITNITNDNELNRTFEVDNDNQSNSTEIIKKDDAESTEILNRTFTENVNKNDQTISDTLEVINEKDEMIESSESQESLAILEKESSSITKSVHNENERIYSPDVTQKYDDDNNDDVFKTPSAKMLMILGTPKSSMNIIEKKGKMDDAAKSRIYDIKDEIRRLNNIFGTSSEFDHHSGISDDDNDEKEISYEPIDNENDNDPLNFDDEFNKLAGRPIIKKRYSNKHDKSLNSTSNISNLSSIADENNITTNEDFPQTDIENWIDNLNEFTTNDHQGENETETNMSGVEQIEGFNETNQSQFCEHLTYSDSSSSCDEMEEKKPDLSNLRKSMRNSLKRTKLSESQFSENLSIASSNTDFEKSILFNESKQTMYKSVENSLIESETSREDASHNKTVFENFEYLPKIKTKRGHSMGTSLRIKNDKGLRRTVYSKPLDSSFDVQAAKMQYEIEKDFENFSSTPVLGELVKSKSLSTENLKKSSPNSNENSRKTVYSKPLDSSFELQAAKMQYEIEKDFENFSSTPVLGELVKSKSLSTENLKKSSPNSNENSRKTVYSKPLDSSFDVQAAKMQYEIEKDFENFSSTPVLGELVKSKSLSTENLKKSSPNSNENSRKTVYSKPLDSSFDVQAAKMQYEIEKDFENFSSNPVIGELVKSKSLSTENLKKSSPNSNENPRKTVNSKPLDSSFDVQAAKMQYEIEKDFENFSSTPVLGELVKSKSLSTENLKKSSPNSNENSRKTVYSKPLDSSFDVQAAKVQYEIEKDFENFSSTPVLGELVKSKSLSTENLKKSSPNMNENPRKTVYSKPLDSSFDVQAAKMQYEIEKDFENFSSTLVLGELVKSKSLSTENLKKLSPNSNENPRKTVYSKPLDSSFDVQAAKMQYEIEKDFENFSSTPVLGDLIKSRSLSLGDLKKLSSKIQKGEVHSFNHFDFRFNDYQISFLKLKSEIMQSVRSEKDKSIKRSEVHEQLKVVDPTIQTDNIFIETEETGVNPNYSIHQINETLKSKTQSTPVVTKEKDDFFITPKSTTRQTRQTKRKQVETVSATKEIRTRTGRRRKEQEQILENDLSMTLMEKGELHNESSVINFSSFLTPLRRSERNKNKNTNDSFAYRYDLNGQGSKVNLLNQMNSTSIFAITSDVDVTLVDGTPVTSSIKQKEIEGNSTMSTGQAVKSRRGRKPKVNKGTVNDTINTESQREIENITVLEKPKEDQLHKNETKTHAENNDVKEGNQSVASAKESVKELRKDNEKIVARTKRQNKKQVENFENKNEEVTSKELIEDFVNKKNVKSENIAVEDREEISTRRGGRNQQKLEEKKNVEKIITEKSEESESSNKQEDETKIIEIRTRRGLRRVNQKQNNESTVSEDVNNLEKINTRSALITQEIFQDKIDKEENIEENVEKGEDMKSVVSHEEITKHKTEEESVNKILEETKVEKDSGKMKKGQKRKNVEEENTQEVVKKNEVEVVRAEADPIKVIDGNDVNKTSKKAKVEKDAVKGRRGQKRKNVKEGEHEGKEENEVEVTVSPKKRVEIDREEIVEEKDTDKISEKTKVEEDNVKGRKGRKRKNVEIVDERKGEEEMKITISPKKQVETDREEIVEEKDTDKISEKTKVEEDNVKGRKGRKRKNVEIVDERKGEEEMKITISPKKQVETDREEIVEEKDTDKISEKTKVEEDNVKGRKGRKRKNVEIVDERKGEEEMKITISPKKQVENDTISEKTRIEKDGVKGKKGRKRKNVEDASEEEKEIEIKVSPKQKRTESGPKENIDKTTIDAKEELQEENTNKKQKRVGRKRKNIDEIETVEVSSSKTQTEEDESVKQSEITVIEKPTRSRIARRNPFDTTTEATGTSSHLIEKPVRQLRSRKASTQEITSETIATTLTRKESVEIKDDDAQSSMQKLNTKSTRRRLPSETTGKTDEKSIHKSDEKVSDENQNLDNIKNEIVTSSPVKTRSRRRGADLSVVVNEIQNPSEVNEMSRTRTTRTRRK